MAIKKSDLYASLWASCDELRGGMDASQYKDYVLFMLFIKYISDKYGNSDAFAPPVVIPKGASFTDMVKLKGKPDIGDKINTQIIQPLIDKNERLARSDFPDFNDPNKLGQGKEMVDRLTNLVGIFQKPELDFSKNRAEHDDILGDAYEYLMRHFATESGKSKGQFYTPSEVSRIIAKVIGISPKNTKASTTAYDPTCGSGSLLLKVAAEAGKHITLEGQEKDVTTAGLARMNMILHDFPTANIVSGNTLANPKFLDGNKLRTYDYVVANPPFSDKTWTSGLTPANDPFQRFGWGEPPTKQGDYAYLLHIIRSMKANGKAACVLPHGVLFRGNAEAVIRTALVRSGILKGIIGLPANLFYGTGIPACILVLDKENAEARALSGAAAGSEKKSGIMMIDASKGFIKDGNKNRLREQDLHKIVDAFTRQQDVPRYARMVPFTEIADTKNDYNLNLPRYIDSSEPEDIQDLAGHLQGGIPERDIDALDAWWQQMPALRKTLFSPLPVGEGPGERARPGYCELKVPAAEVKAAILGHAEFTAFTDRANALFADWQKRNLPKMRAFKQGDHPKTFIEHLAEDLLASFSESPLLDAYDIYQHLMDYWAETMQDDAYLLTADGWVAKPARIIETDKKGKQKDKGWACDLVPKPLVVARYFAKEQAALDAKQAELEAVAGQITELEEEHGGEEGFLGALEKVAKAEINARLKEIKGDKEAREESAVLQQWLDLSEQQSALKKAVKELDAALDKKAHDKYATLTAKDIQTLVIEDKWLTRLASDVYGELDRTGQTLTRRIRELAERYEAPLPIITNQIDTLAAKVNEHLRKMGVITDQTRLRGSSKNWTVKRLGDHLVILKNGINSRAELLEQGEIRYLHYGDIHGSTSSALIPSATAMPFLPRQKAARLDRLVDGDLVFADASEDLDGVGKSVEISGTSGLEVVSGMHTIAVRFDKKVLADGFKAYLQFIPTFRDHLKRLAAGTKVYATNRAHIASAELPLPSIDEQREIAVALADVDREIEALRNRLAKIQAIKQGMMQELLTGRTRLV